MEDAGSESLSKDTPTRSRVGVKTVRGPFIELGPNADYCDSPDELREYVRKLRAQEPGRLLVADLFSGAGGLSLGLEAAGLKTVFAVDHDARAIQTHGHHFGGMSVDWDLSDPELVRATGELLRSIEIDVVAGGPPCQPFSKAGRSKMRHLVREGVRDARDARRELWRSYVDIIRIARPRAVLMENVPDMALDREMFILRSMVYEFEAMGYGVEERVVDTRTYGVPQFRHRLILVALAGNLEFSWPAESEERPKVEDAIGDLPSVEGGARPEGGAEGYWDYQPPRDPNPFLRMMRAGVAPDHERRIYDHITRPVREDDAEAFALMDHTTRYSQLDEKFKRYREDIFDDKYKRLDPKGFSRTITAHIAKDGYWYIHPEEPRTITVREAARIQTFPDWFRFAGPPSAAFKQIGNAVPPLLGRHLGAALIDALESPVEARHTTEEVASRLAGFMQQTPPQALPWLNSGSRWLVLSGELLLERVTLRNLRQVWPSLAKLSTPAELLAQQDFAIHLASIIGREERAQRLIELATVLEEDEHDLTDAGIAELVTLGLIPQSLADVVILAAVEGDPDDCEEPIVTSRGVLRPVSRILKSSVNSRKRLSDGRIAISSLVGFGDHTRLAHTALIEIAARICRPDPDCTICPVENYCLSSRLAEQVKGMLPLTEPDS